MSLTAHVNLQYLEQADSIIGNPALELSRVKMHRNHRIRSKPTAMRFTPTNICLTQASLPCTRQPAPSMELSKNTSKVFQIGTSHATLCALQNNLQD